LADGTVEYGAIPIQITIHDARHADLDAILYTGDNGGGDSLRLPRHVVSLGRFHSVRVKELAPVEKPTVVFPLNALFEIETTRNPWPFPHNPVRSSSETAICRVWKGEDPEPFRAVSPTSEWHATLWFVPATKTPSAYVTLQIEVLLERDDFPRELDGFTIDRRQRIGLRTE
jgi:hypothetical protein